MRWGRLAGVPVLMLVSMWFALIVALMLAVSTLALTLDVWMSVLMLVGFTANAIGSSSDGEKAVLKITLGHTFVRQI